MQKTKTKTRVKKSNKNESENLFGKLHNVILFNDDNTPMDLVAYQIRKATGYSETKCIQLMLEAHKSGRSIIYTGHLERCEHITVVLEQINLGVKIEHV